MQFLTIATKYTNFICKVYNIELRRYADFSKAKLSRKQEQKKKGKQCALMYAFSILVSAREKVFQVRSLATYLI